MKMKCGNPHPDHSTGRTDHETEMQVNIMVDEDIFFIFLSANRPET